MNRYCPGLLLLFLFLVGCGPSPETSSVANPTPRAASNKTKLSVLSHPNGGTGVYQEEFVVASPVLVNGKPIEGQHEIKLMNNATYKGTKPACVVDSLVLMIKHEKPRRSGWQFPPSALVSFVVDGVEIKPVKVIQRELDEESGIFWESLITQPTCEIFQRIASSGSAEIRINNATVKLSAEDLAAFKEFAKAIGGFD